MEPVAFHAFHAYLSTNVPAYSAVHNIIAFDKVVTSVGNGYHSNLGTFITPRSGLCVFTWTIRQWGSRYQKTDGRRCDTYASR